MSSNFHKKDNYSWKLIYNGFKPKQEALRETLCTLGNGYFGTRGAVCESAATKIHYPGTYMAGVYNKTLTHIAGRTVYNEAFVNCPNWLPLTFKIDNDPWISPSDNKIISYHQELDMQKGILSRIMRINDRRGRKTAIETQRMVSMSNPHCAAIKYTIIPQNYDGLITIRSALDGSVENTGVARYRQLNTKHMKTVSIGRFNEFGIYISVKTSQSNIKISEAAKTSIFSKNKKIDAASKIKIEKKKIIYQEFEIPVCKEQRYTIEKIVSIYTSKDKDIKNPQSAAIRCVRKCPHFDLLLKSHQKIWKKLWEKFDIEIEGDSFSQKVLRLHMFHLLQTASIHNKDIDAGLPARGLHGEAYRGHIFWDSLFAMPFFDLHGPRISKSLLLYRYRRLKEARRYAKKHGYKGAMFPWQSASSGVEQSQIIHLNPLSGKWGPDYSSIQRHVSFAIAYSVWQYWIRTADLAFLTHHGAEILLSIAQFGASLAEYDLKDRRYHTDGVMGPDEFHERLPGRVDPGFRDNAYTNLLIVWTLSKAQETLDILPKKHKARLIKKLGIKLKDLFRWSDITHKMNMIHNDKGIIAQFDGYFDLKELNWSAYRKKYRKIGRMDRILKAEGKSPDDYKVAKQADALMIFYLFSRYEIEDLFYRLGYDFDIDILEANYNYYIKRTSHGSTLSKVVHSYLSHLISRSREARHWFLEVLKSDLFDTQGGTTIEGIHTGVIGGSIDIVIKGFAGVNITDEGININPSLPKKWRSLKLKLRYKRNWIYLSITKRKISILLQGKSSIPIEVRGISYSIPVGRTVKLGL
ncbi:MAG: glycosyl hydrolase family 65 protein [Candidatus Omnitrophota bacterium]